MAACRPEPNQAQDVVQCKYCNNQSAESYCKTCREEMCLKCCKKHLDYYKDSNHVTVPYKERQFAGENCREHATQFYNAGCKDCNIPICPECKLKYHYSHTDTIIAEVCESARKNVETRLKRMEVRQSRVSCYIDEGTNFGEDFTQIKKKLESRALELKSCVENILSESLVEVKTFEEAHKGSVNSYVNNLTIERDTLEERIQICSQNLKSMGPIELAFYEEEYMNLNQTNALQGLRIPRFNTNPLKIDDMKRLFGFLSIEETTVGERDNVQANRPRTAAARLLRLEDQPSRIPKTDRSDRSRPNSASFVSLDNMKRFSIGVCESPILIKEFKSCINILFQITYSEQFSRVFISGDKPAIYTYKNSLVVKNVESKLEELSVSREPQGLAMGLTGNLVYSDRFNGVVEIEPDIIDDIQHNSVIKIQRNAKIIFYKKGYTTWGVHCTKFGEFLICIVPNSEKNNYAAVVKITLDDTHSKISTESEFTHKSSEEPLFSNPRFVCENRKTDDICVSDFDNKVIVLSASGKFRFSYTGNRPAIQKSTTFTPRGISCSGQGHILVADVENDLVHMLQSDGKFITHILSSISSISRPWGICVDAVDRIWLVEEQKYESGVKCLTKVKVFQIYNKGL